MKKLLSTILMSVMTFSIVCFANPIYNKVRKAGIELFNRGQYQIAIQQFISAQNIAPINNDLSSWITKCYNKMVLRRNARVKKVKSSIVPIEQSRLKVGNKICKYDSIGQYGSANLALVRLNNQYGFINRDSILIVPIKYDDVYSLPEAITGTRTDELYRANDSKWNWSWEKGQLMSVCKDGKWGYLNDKGKEVVPTIYDDVREHLVSSERHLIGVGNDGKYGFVNRNGKVIIPLEYDCVSQFYEGVFDTGELGYDMVPVVKDGKMGFINNNGDIVIPFEYEPRYDLDYNTLAMFIPVWFNGNTRVKKNGKYGIIDNKGNPISGFKYDDIGEVNLVNVGGEYETYYVFSVGNNKIYYFDGREYNSEARFYQAVTAKTISQSGMTDVRVKIVDTERQAKDQDYIRLKLMKDELSRIQNIHEIKAFNYFSEGIAIVELNNGICLFYQDKKAVILDNVSIYWPHYNSGLLGCCYLRSNHSAKLDGFYLDTEGNVAFSKIKLPNGAETVIGSRYGKKICGGPFNSGFADVWHYKGTTSKHGKIDSNGTLIVSCDYATVSRVTNGFVAKKGNNVLFLDNSSNVLEKIKNATMDFWSQSEFIVRVYGEGYRRYSGSFEWLERSDDRLYLPNNKNLYITQSYRKYGNKRKYGYCNDKGKVVIPITYQEAKPFSDGLAAVCIDNKYGFIDTTGNLVISNMFEDAGSFNEGIAWIKKSGFYYYIDKTGKLLNTDKYSYADDFHEGLGIVRKGKLYGVVAKSGLSTFDIL